MPMAPCPTAGRNSSTSSTAVAASARPSRFSPASASNVASATPSSSLRSRVSTLPRSGTIDKIGAQALHHRLPAQRRGADRRAARQLGDGLRLAADEQRRAGPRAPETPTAPGPSGSTVGMSLDECTARSIVPATSASSISLVNRPLPPTSASGRSWMRSPLVRITSISIRSGSRPCAAASACRTMRACASASGLPRVPSRRMMPEDCATGPRNCVEHGTRPHACTRN